MEQAINNSLAFLLSKAQQSMRNRFAAMLKADGLEVTVEQWSVLNVVRARDDASQSDIANATGTDKANIMRMIDLMEAKGLLERVPDPADRRVRRIRLTDQGQQMIDRITPLAKRVNQLAAEGLSADELEGLKACLRTVRNNLSAS